MKLYKVVGVLVLLITVSLTLFALYGKNSSTTSTKSAIVSSTTTSDRKDIKKIMQKIDVRVKKVKDKLNGEC